MRSRPAFLVFLLLAALSAVADPPMCGTSEELEERVRAHHERRVVESRVKANAATLPATVRDGAFYMQADDRLTYGARLFDLAGKSLVFEPRAGGKFATRVGPLQSGAAGTLLHDFGPKTGSPWHYVTYDLGSFAFPIFGRNVTRLYLTAFNEIEFDVPAEEGAGTFEALEAAVHRNAMLSPLAITSRKPRQLAYPQVFVRETPTAVFVTWRSTAGDPFGYDLQAELRSDGTVVFSYNSLREMQWGTPVVTAGFDPAGTTPRRSLYSSTAVQGVNAIFGALGPMLDIRNVEVSRMGESDVLAVTLTMAAPIDLTKIPEGDTLRYGITVEGNPAYVDVTRSGFTVLPQNGLVTVPNGAAVRISGDKVELYVLQSFTNTTPLMRASTQQRPSRQADAFSWSPTLDAAPRRTVSDFSAIASGTELTAPFAEPFMLPEFDPIEAWDRIQQAYAISKYDVDAVAIYQNFYTDMIFYAGAYSIGGNPGVSGIAGTSPNYGFNIRRTPNVLHMNHFRYNYNAATETASQVILHEFGHRWLYFVRILEDGTVSNALNPVSAHPAAFVHTPSAFPVFREGESSTMGGAVFSDEGSGSYRTHVANRGYSWVDLYLMGLAAPEEVQPWFYLAGTSLRGEYWPDDNIVVNGTRREVSLSQLTAVHGPRNPSTALAQKTFRVLFVLVTEAGKEPADADVAKMNEWRALFERTFSLATGGRGRVETAFVQPPKKRATR